MAISTYGIKLLKGTTVGETTTYSQLVDIKDFTDMGAAPATIETTTLSSDIQTFLQGVAANPVMTFTANYDVDDYEALIALTGTNKFALQFSDSSAFTWEGELSVFVVGGGVNGVVNMKISVVPSSKIVKEDITVA